MIDSAAVFNQLSTVSTTFADSLGCVIKKKSTNATTNSTMIFFAFTSTSPSHCPGGRPATKVTWSPGRVQFDQTTTRPAVCAVREFGLASEPSAADRDNRTGRRSPRARTRDVRVACRALSGRVNPGPFVVTPFRARWFPAGCTQSYRGVIGWLLRLLRRVRR